MSGFVAVLARRGASIEESLLARLARPLAVHGATPPRFWREGPIGMAHVLRVARDGARSGPHDNGAGHRIAGDVRLDARDALRRALAAAGVSAMGAYTTSDMDDDALVLAAWRAWGNDAAAHLRGDFSFALWDAASRTLLCARDGLGVRPLYFAEVAGAFICSNVLDAVRAHPGVSATLHEPAVLSFLHVGYNVELDRTTFADVRRLAPGHACTVRADAPASTPRAHWHFPDPAPLRFASADDYGAALRDRLGDAVRDRLRLPGVAMLMSGGLDSTGIAAMARAVAPAAELTAFTSLVSSVIPDDEERFAAAVARRHGLRHVVIDDPTLMLAHLDDPAVRTPEPLDDPDHALWRSMAARIARESPVVFVGEDGDTMLKPPGLLTMLRTLPPGEVLASVTRYTVKQRRHPHLGIWWRRRLRALFERPDPGALPWVREAVLRRSGVPREVARPAHRTRPDAHRGLTAAIWQSVLESYDPAWSGSPLEARWPLLDERMLEYAFAVPPVPWCQRKELFRSAFRDALPSEVLARPKTPLSGYIEGQVARWRAARGSEAVGLGARALEFVDGAAVQAAIEKGTVPQVLAAWRVLILDHWLRGL